MIGSNCVRSLALLLATAAVGGIFASFATDMGEKVSSETTALVDAQAKSRNQALHDRLSQLHPRVIFAESSYSYNGRLVDISEKITNCTTRDGGLGKSQLVIIGSLLQIHREW